MTATLARGPGATEVRDKGALTYGLHDQEMKAVVKKGSTREEDVCGTGRGSRGTGASRFTAPRRPGVPQAASGSS
jgi:hypothetical protein